MSLGHGRRGIVGSFFYRPMDWWLIKMDRIDVDPMA